MLFFERTAARQAPLLGDASCLDGVLSDFVLFAALLGENLEAGELAAVEPVDRQESVGGKCLTLSEDEKDVPLLPNTHVFDDFELALVLLLGGCA